MPGPETARLVVLHESETLARQLERVAATHLPHVEVVRCDDFDAVDLLLAGGRPFDILVSGPAVIGDHGLARLRALRARRPPLQLILAFDEWPRRGLRDTVRTGAIDILRLPVADRSLADAIEQGLAIAVAAPAPPAAVPPPTSDGAVIAVVSATGGCGKTFFAANLAYHLETRGKRTCLLDLDLQFGEASAALQLQPSHTISDLLALDADHEELGRQLEKHLVVHQSGIRVLAAPETPEAAARIDADDVARVIEAARSRFDYVIVDAPAALRESVLVSIELADRIYAMATLDLPSIRNLSVMLTTLRRLQVPDERVQLLLNKVERDVGIEVGEVQRYFPQGFAMVIPYGREVNRSLNLGQPVLADAPGCEVSKALAGGLAQLAPGSGPASGAAAEPPPRRRFARREKVAA